MNNGTLQELFTITGEECAELIMVMSKRQRFGYSEDNHHNLKQELGDLQCMINLFIRMGLITREELDQCCLNKMKKLAKYSSLPVE